MPVSRSAARRHSRRHSLLKARRKLLAGGCELRRRLDAPHEVGVDAARRRRPLGDRPRQVAQGDRLPRIAARGGVEPRRRIDDGLADLCQVGGLLLGGKAVADRRRPLEPDRIGGGLERVEVGARRGEAGRGRRVLIRRAAGRESEHGGGRGGQEGRIAGMLRGAARRPADAALPESASRERLSPRRPEAVLPRARGAGPRALARARRLPRDRCAAARGSADLELLRGAADRERQARLPPRALARLQGHLSRATRRCAATTCRARPAGTATACRSSSRSSASSASARRTRSRRYGIAEFNQRCRESVFRYVEEWNRLTERIGFWIDLDDAYVTLDNDYIESVWWALRRIWDDGRLYEGHKVVPYCPRCGTALSSHEVALGYHDVEDPSVYVRLPVAPCPSDEPGARSQAGDPLLVWTTTPWTLVSNAAVAVGPELEYVRARRPAGRGLRARGRAGSRRCSARTRRCSPASPGAALAGTALRAAVRLHHRLRPARPHACSRPTSSPPTTAPASCTPRSPSARTTSASASSTGSRSRTRCGPTARFDERIADFAGRFVKDADPDIVEALRERGRLLPRRALRARLPALLALRHAAPLLREVELVHPHDRRPRPDARRATSRSTGTRTTSSTGASASGSRTTSTGRSRASATGARRCRSGSAPSADCEERFCAGSIAELRERGGDVPDDLHRPYIDEVDAALRGVRRGDAARRRR